MLPGLATVEAVIAYVGAGAAGDTALIESMVTAYSAAVRKYCNRDFTLTAYTETYDGKNNSRILLAEYPVVSVQAVAIDGREINAQQAIGQIGYRFDRETLILDGYRFSRGDGNITVSWTAGYVEIPADITQAVIELVALRYEQKDNIGWISKGLAGETITLDRRSMPASVEMILAQWMDRVPR